MDHEWEAFYAKYRADPQEAPQELLDFIEELEIDPELIDDSNHVAIVMDYNEWNDVLNYLEATGAPIPRYISMSPMHADTRKMSNELNTRSKDES